MRFADRRRIAMVFAVAWFMCSALGAAAYAQTATPPAMRQVPLTQKDIDNFLAASPDLDAAIGKEQGGVKPADMPKLDAVAKKHGFDSYSQLMGVNYSISLVLDGMDPSTKTYIGPATVLKAQINELEGDKTVPAAEKKNQLADLQEQLQSVDKAEKPIPANVDVVKQNFDRLNATDQSESD